MSDTNYLVTWSIDVNIDMDLGEGESPHRQAAKMALESLLRPDTIARVFEVTVEDGTHTIDLSEPGGDVDLSTDRRTQ